MCLEEHLSILTKLKLMVVNVNTVYTKYTVAAPKDRPGDVPPTYNGKN